MAFLSTVGGRLLLIPLLTFFGFFAGDFCHFILVTTQPDAGAGK